jgi:hypothetical protein
MEPPLASATEFRRIAMSLDGTSEAPHFDRTAFRVRRIYATLAADGKTANLMLTPAEQALKCLTAPEIFAPVPGGWGKNGATTVALAAASLADLTAALTMAHAHALARSRPRRKG